MKKLTAGIFAGILTIVGVNAADASIASKAYVDQERDKVQANVTTLENTVNTFQEGIDTTITNQIKEELTSDTSDISKALAEKASASDVTALTGRVTTAEGDIDALESKVGDATAGLVKDVADLKTSVGTGGSVATQIADALKNYTTTTDMNTELGKKQDKSTADYALGTAGGGWKPLTDAEKAALQSGVSSTTVGQVATNATAIGTLNSLSTTEKTNLVGAINEVRNVATGAATQANFDALKAQVDNETTGLAAAHSAITAEKTRAEGAEKANADAITKLQASFNGIASENGKYVLTVNQIDGEKTFYWEQIERPTTTPASATPETPAN